MFKIERKVSLEWILDKVPSLALVLQFPAIGGWNINPFYEDHWLPLYKEWIFVPILLTLGAVVLCRIRRGVIITLVITFVCSLVFGYLYPNEKELHESWRVLAWLLSYSIPGSIVVLILTTFRPRVKTPEQ